MHFLSQVFNKKLCQDDAGSLLKIESATAAPPKAMAKQYDLGLVASPSVWGQIFKHLKTNEIAMTVASPTHTIATPVVNGEFRVYDPSQGKIYIASNESLLAKKILPQIFSQNNDELLPLTVNVFSHPDKINQVLTKTIIILTL
ncbi:hypothetical protein [Legionella jordanis]|uniref:Ankyrin repeat-containing protein n=2 Tax=Legionella jordanis TaxID=456 RepID=A0A0W0VD74_9GAMM|nr:hypothetical protein [Legionella jordanis]KTD18064.1 ankyrin repeat-containing protein [Legionella jordanis]RMX02251.1 hypothetical protein EAW55_08290 [Legionella jordanis]RMX21264.1 hypothetical protein EAS68_03580 [Legionella jordanis]VEH13844.1 ankyrin repeat-containing protein [Legionella jordanis]